MPFSAAVLPGAEIPPCINQPDGIWHDAWNASEGKHSFEKTDQLAIDECLSDPEAEALAIN